MRRHLKMHTDTRRKSNSGTHTQLWQTLKTHLSPLSTANCPLFTVHHSPLPTVHCPLSSAHFPLSTTHFPLSTVHHPLSTAQCPPCPTIHHGPLSTAHCPLPPPPHNCYEHQLKGGTLPPSLSQPNTHDCKPEGGKETPPRSPTHMTGTWEPEGRKKPKGG